MSTKKFVVVLVVVMLFSFAGCGKSGAGGTEDVSEIIKSVQALEEMDSYVINTQMQLPSGNVMYLEVKSGEESYTDYPATEDGTVKSGDDVTSETTYSLSDWIMADGTMYSYRSTGESDDSVGMYKMPEGYGERCKDRVYMYMHRMFDSGGLYNVEKAEDEKYDMQDGNGEQTYTVYKARLKAEAVKDILGVNTIDLYESIKEDSTADDNMKHFADLNLSELDMSLTFSDAIVRFYIKDGVLIRFYLEAGGLGSRMYMNKTVYTNLDYQKRETPDISNSMEYLNTIKEVSEYCKDFDTYEDAMMAMSNAESSELLDSEGTSAEGDTSEDGSTSDEGGIGSESDVSDDGTTENTDSSAETGVDEADSQGEE